MNAIQIFIISNHLMFGYGLESLLRQESDFDIVGQEKDINQAIERIKKLQPDVVVLDNDSSVSQITPILQASPGVKIISLNLNNNDLYVYRAKQWVARGTEDLVTAIKDDLYTIKPQTGKESNNEAF